MLKRKEFMIKLKQIIKWLFLCKNGASEKKNDDKIKEKD